MMFRKKGKILPKKQAEISWDVQLAVNKVRHAAEQAAKTHTDSF